MAKHPKVPTSDIRLCRPGQMVSCDFVRMHPDSPIKGPLLVHLMDKFAKISFLYPTMGGGDGERWEDCWGALEHWIGLYGTPSTLSTDSGPSFVAPQWTQLCQALGIGMVCGPARRPQAHTTVEGRHRFLHAGWNCLQQDPQRRVLPLWRKCGLLSGMVNSLSSRSLAAYSPLEVLLGPKQPQPFVQEHVLLDREVDELYNDWVEARDSWVKAVHSERLTKVSQDQLHGKSIAITLTPSSWLGGQRVWYWTKGSPTTHSGWKGPATVVGRLPGGTGVVVAHGQSCLKRGNTHVRLLPPVRDGDGDEAPLEGEWVSPPRDAPPDSGSDSDTEAGPVQPPEPLSAPPRDLLGPEADDTHVAEPGNREAPDPEDDFGDLFFFRAATVVRPTTPTVVLDTGLIPSPSVSRAGPQRVGGGLPAVHFQDLLPVTHVTPLPTYIRGANSVVLLSECVRVLLEHSLPPAPLPPALSTSVHRLGRAVRRFASLQSVGQSVAACSLGMAVSTSASPSLPIPDRYYPLPSGEGLLPPVIGGGEEGVGADGGVGAATKTLSCSPTKQEQEQERWIKAWRKEMSGFELHRTFKAAVPPRKTSTRMPIMSATHSKEAILSLLRDTDNVQMNSTPRSEVVTVVGARAVFTLKPAVANSADSPLSSPSLPPERVAKVRVVVQGFLGPGGDLRGIERSNVSSPTPAWSNILTLVSLSAHRRWAVASLDVPQAFLRVSRSLWQRWCHRFGRVFVRAPKGVPQTAFPLALRDSEYWEAEGPSYGLLEIPALWHFTFQEEVLSLGHHSTKSRAVWTMMQGSCCVGVLVVHVDDILAGGTPQYMRWLQGEFSRAFGTGSWGGGTFLYCGVQFEQLEDFSCELSLHLYISSISTVAIESGAADDEPLSQEHRSGARRLIGQLLWASQRCAPDSVAACCISASTCGGPEAQLRHLRDLNQALKRTQKSHRALAFLAGPVAPHTSSIPSLTSLSTPADVLTHTHTVSLFEGPSALTDAPPHQLQLELVTWVDQGMRTECDDKKRRQLGYVSALVHPDFALQLASVKLPGAPFPCPSSVCYYIDWGSQKSPRISHSSFAGEVQAVYQGYSSARKLHHQLNTILRAESPQNSLPLLLLCDNEKSVSLLGSVEAEATDPGVEQQVACLQESQAHQECRIRWLPRHLNVADGLSKMGCEGVPAPLRDSGRFTWGPPPPSAKQRLRDAAATQL